MTTPTHRAVNMLTEGAPTSHELIDLYHTLRTVEAETPVEDAAQYALAQIVGEMLDYLDLVAQEFEKSIGLSTEAERQRVLAAFEPPSASSPAAQAGELVDQWRDVDRYSPKEVLSSVDEVAPHS